MGDLVNDTIQMRKSYALRLSNEHCRRWRLDDGTEVVVRETSEGLLLAPSNPPLIKVNVDPTTSCNLNCRTCISNSLGKLHSKSKPQDAIKLKEILKIDREVLCGKQTQ